MIPCTTQDLIDAKGCDSGMDKVFAAFPDRPLDEVVNALDYELCGNTRSEAWQAAHLLCEAGHFTEEQCDTLEVYLQKDAENVLVKERIDVLLNSAEADLQSLPQEERFAAVRAADKQARDEIWAEFVAVTESITW